MNGECKSFRLNDPMTWNEFVSMPEDIQVTYIKLLRDKFGCPDSKIGAMMGADKDKVSRYFMKIGLRQGHVKRNKPFDNEGFYAWVNGVDKLPAPVISEVTPEEKKKIFFGGTENLPEEKIRWAESEPIKQEPEIFADEDIPWDIPDPVPVEECKTEPVTAVPTSGRLSFLCPANQALNTIAQLLGDANVRISVSWDVIAEGGEVISG